MARTKMSLMQPNSQFFSLRPRRRDEHNRVATPLELLFDLSIVIAVASAAAGLHHAISDAHAAEGVLAFAFAFFAIWWAWMNYTWFASAYDDGGPWFRLLTMVIIAGTLTVAAGVPAFFAAKAFVLVWLGYLVMRLAQAMLWVSAALGDPERRVTALRYAAGILLAQVYWTSLLLLAEPGSALFAAAYAAGIAIELAVPAFAERANDTPWHRHHIIERYGLLNIIVLGECMLASVNALRRADVPLSLSNPLLHIGVSAAVMTFVLWWAYFQRDEHLPTQDRGRAFAWGYGHVVLFAAGASVGAGFGVLIDIVTQKAKVPLRVGDIAVAVPVALYLAALWFVRDRHLLSFAARYSLILGAMAVLTCGLFLPAPLELMTLCAVAAVAARSTFGRRSGDHPMQGHE
jgi:low temperature requirement protein LtrA